MTFCTNELLLIINTIYNNQTQIVFLINFNFVYNNRIRIMEHKYLKNTETKKPKKLISSKSLNVQKMYVMYF